MACYIGPIILKRIPEILRKTKNLNIFENKTNIFTFPPSLVAKAPGLNLVEKLSNLLSNRGALNWCSTFCIFFPFQNNEFERFLKWGKS